MYDVLLPKDDVDEKIEIGQIYFSLSSFQAYTGIPSYSPDINFVNEDGLISVNIDFTIPVHVTSDVNF